MRLDWTRIGPRVLVWLATYVGNGGDPHGAQIACAAAFAGDGVTRGALHNFLGNGLGAERWRDIKAGRMLPTTPDAPAQPSIPPAPIQEVNSTTTEEGIEARSQGRKIKTVADLLTHIEADMSRFEIASSEATKYEGLTKDDEGNAVVTEMFRVFVRLKPKTGASVEEAVTALLDGAFRNRVAPKVKALPIPAGDIWQLIDLFDWHLGKYAWRGSTGGPDYDMQIAERCVAVAGADLIARGNAMCAPARRTIALGGDLFHYDTPGGTTTAGTPLERDGRYQKMIDMGADAIIALIEQSAATVPTDVVLVPGNHDEVLSCAFQRILIERFRNDQRVSVDRSHLSRKYLTWGKNLIGIAHGHKAKKKLPQLMALERPDLWGASTYREMHTGHLHYQAAEWQRPIETIDGVIVRIAPSLGPPDDWHAVEGFIGATRGMETFFYRKAGGLVGMFMSSPDFA